MTQGSRLSGQHDLHRQSLREDHWLEAKPPKELRARSARGEAHVRTRRGSVVDLVEEPGHNLAAQASAPMLGRSDDVSEVEVPTAVADGSPHSDNVLPRVVNMTEGPTALNRSQRLGCVLGMQTRGLAKAEIVRDSRRLRDQRIGDRTGSAHAWQANRSDSAAVQEDARRRRPGTEIAGGASKAYGLLCVAAEPALRCSSTPRAAVTFMASISSHAQIDIARRLRPVTISIIASPPRPDIWRDNLRIEC